jgi:hypothetical protein
VTGGMRRKHCENGNFTQLLTENFEEKSNTCGRPMHKCKGNITVYLQEIK